MKALLFALLLALPLAAQELLTFENEQQRQLYQQLAAELRCPQCQNQNIADSNAVVAVDMRQKTYELVRDGQSRQQILDYMISRYGDFVHYQPPVTPYTIWLWLAPVTLLLLLLGVGVLRRFKTGGNETTTDKTPDTAELDKLIARYRSKKS